MKNKDIQPGAKISHMGTRYEIVSISAGLVAVWNPLTGYRSEIPAAIIRNRSRLVEQPKPAPAKPAGGVQRELF